MKLPPGFQLEGEGQNNINLPPGFQLESNDPNSDSRDKSSIGQNALREVSDMTKASLPMLGSSTGTNPYTIGKSIFQASRGTPFMQTDVGRSIENIPRIPGQIYDRAKELILHPVRSFHREPIRTTMDVASVVGGASELTPAVSKVSSPIFRKTMSWMGDIPEESVKYRMENPGLPNSREISDIATSNVPQMAGKFDQVIKGLHGEAKKLLSRSRFIEPTAGDMGGAFTKDEVFGAIDYARKKLGGVYTSEGESAARTLSNISENLNKIRNTVSQNQVHDLIIDLDREIPWDRVNRSPENLTLQDKALIDARTRLDSMLKERNTPYKEIMRPIADAIQNKNEFLKNFNVQKIKNAGYQPSNSTVSRIFGATNQDRVATNRILKNTKETIGEDLTPSVKAAQVKADFESDSGGVFNPTGVKQIVGRPVAKGMIDFLGGTKSVLKKTPSPRPLFGPSIAGSSILGANREKAKQEKNTKNNYSNEYQNQNNGDGNIESITNHNASPLVGGSVPQGKKKVLDEKNARKYLKKAEGNKDKARQYAMADGWMVA